MNRRGKAVGQGVAPPDFFECVLIIVGPMMLAVLSVAGGLLHWWRMRA